MSRKKIESIAFEQYERGYKTNKERWICDQVIEMSNALGMRVPNLVLVDAVAGRRELWRRTIGLADQAEHKVTLRTRGAWANRNDLRKTIAHELLHLAFPKIGDGHKSQQLYITALLKLHLAFRGNGIITEVFKPEPPTDARVAVLLERKKRLQTKVKRASTAIKKIERRIRNLERSKEEEEQQQQQQKDGGLRAGERLKKWQQQ
jgi:hypothetical protein